MLTGAVCGLLFWLVYGIIEFGLTCVFPLFTSDSQISPWQWPLIAELFLVYALAGLVFGMSGGALLNAVGRRTCEQAVAALTFVLAFIANLIPGWPLARSENIAIGVAVVLGFLLFASIVSPAWHKRTAFLEGPWTICLLLVSGPWISRDLLHDSSALVKLGVSWIALGAILVWAWTLFRLRFRRTVPAIRQTVTAAAAAGLLALAVWFAPNSAISAAQAPPAVSAGKPNVVLITMDTVRADHLSIYGYERNTTPNLSQLARGATVYTHAIAAADFTLPTHASIFTGLYPAWHGAVFAPPQYPLGRPLGPQAVTLADVLRSHGYWTAAVVANRGYLSPTTGLLKSFTEAQPFGPVLLTSPDRRVYLRLGAQRILSLVADTAGFEAISLRATDVNRRAFAVLDRARLYQSKSGTPFFLFLNYMDAHQPYVPPPPFYRLFPGRNVDFRAADYEGLKKAMLTGQRGITTEERNHLIAQYDGGIAYIDAEIGNLLSHLRAAGLYDHTLIVITSDHGEAFGEHGLLEHAVDSLYQDQILVPLLIKYPQQSAADRFTANTSQVDLMPTILSVCALPVPGGMQGRSLLTGGSPIVFAEARPSPESEGRGIRRAVFDGPMKLIATTDGSHEVYDVDADPAEEHNLYDSENPRWKALEERLAAWIASMPRQAPSVGKLDKSTVERLKSLGYVQ
jgi:arylsulfatase A-like enzyme